GLVLLYHCRGAFSAVGRLEQVVLPVSRTAGPEQAAGKSADRGQRVVEHLANRHGADLLLTLDQVGLLLRIGKQPRPEVVRGGRSGGGRGRDQWRWARYRRGRGYGRLRPGVESTAGEQGQARAANRPLRHDFGPLYGLGVRDRPSECSFGPGSRPIFTRVLTP